MQFENFTWDWIYEGYVQETPGLRRHIETLAQAYATARYHLQAEPFCLPAAGADGRIKPIGRRPRSNVAATRATLGLKPGERLVLVTLGGVPDQPRIPAGTLEPGVVYGLAGAAPSLRRAGPWLFLPYHSPVYYPDLLAASDAVIAKLGYSTLAEAYHAGVPFGFLPRARFPESPIIAAFARREMAAMDISAEEFLAGHWLPAAEQLLALPRRPHPALNGADQAAEFIIDLLG